MVTMMGALAVIPLSAAWMDVEPAATAVARPLVLMVATDGLAAVHVTEFDRLAVELSL